MTTRKKLTNTPKVQHRIITEDVQPIALRPYRVPHTKKEILNKEITKMLECGVIKKRFSPWSAPVVMVEKKRHPGEQPEIKVCIDYRKLNAITKSDFFPLPNINETIDQIQFSSLFTVLDLASGY